MNITYRLASENDYPSILLLYNKMYQSNRSLEEFKWLVEDNPAGRAILFIALIKGKVVGMQSLIPYDFIRGGERIGTYKSEDSLVVKELRGKGVFSELYRMLHEYVGDKLVWGLTDKKEILTRVKMPSSERLTIAVSVKKPMWVSDKKGLHRFVVKTMYYSYLYFRSTFQTQKVEAKLKQKEITQADFNNVDLQAFFSKLSQQNPSLYFPVLDEKYLNWRLANNPNLEDYKIVVSSEASGSICICSIIGIEGRAAYWQSLYVLHHVSDDEIIGHINLLRESIFSSGTNLIHTWLFDCNSNVMKMKKIFLKSGFSKVREGLWIVHNSTEKEMNVHDLYFSPLLGIR